MILFLGRLGINKMIKILVAASAADTELSSIPARLKQAGFEVLTAKDGATAMRVLESHQPDLAVVDMDLETMDGLSLSGWLKDHRKLHKIPVVLLVDPEAMNDPNSLADSGMADMVLKPVRISELVARVMLRVDNEAKLATLFSQREVSRMALQETLSSYLFRHRNREEEILGLFFTDPETGLNNRAYFKIKLSEELKRAQRYGHPLSALLIKLSSGESELENGEEGNPPSSLTLKEIAGILLLESRDLDIIGRFGYSDFSLLLPDTDQDGAVFLAQRISEHIITHPFTENTGGRDFQVRIGVATYPLKGVHRPQDFMNRAYEALKKAQSYGKKEICIWESAVK